MARVKICGITNRDDVMAASELGVDALGFIFVPESPRFIGSSPNVVALLASVPPFISRVGVCVRPDAIDPEVRRHLDVLQVYDHSCCSGNSDSPITIPVFRLRAESDLDGMESTLAATKPPAIHLDTYTERSLGGAGVVFDWELAKAVQRRFRIRVILAGGLTPENVSDSIHQANPYAVDVSSGVEHAPGQKDFTKMEKFVMAVRAASCLRQQPQ